ncbi:MAG TPA: hypothetical protein EYO76_00190, partial [Flavobacteriaceae bacterium]|nr:hypothetical protein [Flavobacteriaceae bacterium]
MKTNKILAIILSMFFAIAITSCVQDDDFSVPNATGNEENAKLNDLLAKIDAGTVDLLSFDEVISNFADDDATPFPSEAAVKGYVSSSDE